MLSNSIPAMLEASELPTSWLEPVPLAYRKIRGFTALGIALIIALVLIYPQWRSGNFDELVSTLAFFILAFGAWRHQAWIQKKPVRKYQTIKVTLTKGQRFQNSLPFLMIGFGLFFILLMDIIYNGNSMYSWYLPIPGSIGLFGIFSYFLKLTQDVDTPEAAKMRAFYTAQSEKNIRGRIEKIWHFVIHKSVRYPASAGLLWFAYMQAQEPKPDWLGICSLVFWALVGVKEISLWLLAVGLIIGALVLGFNLIAALPISIAIIIGALILAGAINGK